jgi:glycosyltransferase involved in cell wall biosynthesis
MKILFTGNYEPNYNRTKIIRKGLLELGHEVRELPFKKLNSQIKSELLQKSQDCDFVFLPSFTHKEVKAVKQLVAPPVLFDPLISRYLTKIFDYELAFKWGITALRNFYRDKTPMQAADLVFADTEAHRQYFHRTFKVPLEKMRVLPIGNDFSEFYPEEKPANQVFTVGFYGGFIPLQGALKIIEVAQLLRQENLRFVLIGTGFQYELAKKRIAQLKLTNLELPGWLDENSLRDQINGFDVCLGIFGDTLKAELVIPNKVYHYAACAKPFITIDTPAIRELFTDQENCLLCSGGPAAMAEAILTLKNDPSLRTKIGQGAHQLMRERYHAGAIAQRLIESFRSLQGANPSLFSFEKIKSYDN